MTDPRYPDREQFPLLARDLAAARHRREQQRAVFARRRRIAVLVLVCGLALVAGIAAGFLLNAWLAA
ncbi:hypothetical protein AB0L82_43115 [Nocardia sp. NPDC052001]|uniref:hypothetical protein n=1 Tax=Nocardia sp. NPDC052001 TaxID=3154853 RepID=UPI0034482FBB